ncbi:MAG: DMT family transporter [Betaproteobacteria bacterium]
MRRTSRFPAVWRFALLVFALVTATQYAIETFHAPQGLRSGILDNGLFKGEFLRERGPTTFVVDPLPPGSPLIAAGVVPGDRLRWSDPVGRWINVPVGEQAELTVTHGDETRAIRVTIPDRGEVPRILIVNYLLDNISRLAALLIGVAIGWRRSDLATYRWLAIAGMMQANAFPFSAPASAHLPWLDFSSSFSQELALAAMVFFAINYPDDRPIGWRAVLKRWYPWYFGFLVAVALWYYVGLYAGRYEPLVRPLGRVNAIVLPILFVGSVLLAWYRSQGESRIRLQWILATLGTIMVASLVGNINALAGSPLPAETTGLILNIAIFVAVLGFAYALMRRRIFDFGLAVNRTLVFAIVGAILLGVFQVANRLATTFLHFDDENKTILLSGILAVAVYLSFTQLKKVVERLVDRLFFGAWTAREEDLEAFVAEGRHATDPHALSTLLVAALDRFTENAGVASYRRHDDGHFRRVSSTLHGAPEEIGPNDETVLAMLAHRKAWRLRDGAAGRAVLAVPMVHRSALEGFVLLGARHVGEPYRADQVDQLESAVREIGLDFHALRVDQLTGEIVAERRSNETLRAQLATAAEMTSRRTE